MGHTQWCMRVTFDDKQFPREHLTKDLRAFNPEWDGERYRRPIASLEFFLPTGHRIILSGMEQYNFFVEATEGLGGDGARIEAFWFLGKLPRRPVVDAWRVGNGRADHMHKPWGQEWGGTATRGWKRGAIGGACTSAIVDGGAK